MDDQEGQQNGYQNGQMSSSYEQPKQEYGQNIINYKSSSYQKSPSSYINGKSQNDQNGQNGMEDDEE